MCIYNGYAQEDTVKTGELLMLSLEELMNVEVITASKKVQKITDAPSVISVMTKYEIERLGVTSLIDVLEYMPAIETSMGTDGHYRIAIRGSRKYGNILFLLNGQAVNDFYDGRPVFDLPVALIEKIEVISGPGSALFGTNAVAGIINVITSQAEESLSITTGDHSTFSQNINYTIQKKNYKVAFSAGYFQSNGANVKIESDQESGQPWSLTYADKKGTTNRWIKDTYVNTNVNYKKLNFNLFGISRNKGAWIGHNYILSPESELKTDQLTGSISYMLIKDKKISIIPKLYSNIIAKDLMFQEAPDGYISSVSGNVFTDGKLNREKYTALTIGSDIQMNINLNDDFDLITGYVIENQSIKNYDVKRNYKITGDEYKVEFGNYDNVSLDQRRKDRTIIAYYFQGNYRLNKLDITSGFRFDNYSDFGQSFNPRLGLIYKPLDNLRFKILYGKAFRTPTFKELYDNTTIGNVNGIKGNKKLEPETVDTYELAGEFTFQKFIFRNVYFLIYNNNLIEIYDPNGKGGIGKYENIGNTVSRGYSLETTIEINKGIRYFANFSQYFTSFNWNTETATKADIIYFDRKSECDKFLVNAPTIKLNSGIFWKFLKFDLFAGINYGNASKNNKRFYLEESRFVEIPAYLQADFGVIYQYNEKWKFRIAGNNLGKKYSDPEESTNINAFGKSGMLQPGSTYTISLICKFE